MAASQDELNKLHRMLARQMIAECEFHEREDMPMPAADKSAIAKFLKDNSITADPAQNADLEALQAKLLGQPAPGSTALQKRLEDISPDDVRLLYN